MLGCLRSCEEYDVELEEKIVYRNWAMLHCILVTSLHGHTSSTPARSRLLLCVEKCNLGINFLHLDL